MRNITLQGVGKSFGEKTILTNVRISLSEGDRLALIGENGAGKTTLLRILCGKLNLDTGKLLSSGNNCVYIAQDFSGSHQETPHEFLSKRVKNIKRAVKLLKESGFDFGKNQVRFHHVYCSDFSGGEKKKIEIVAGLASDTPFIALDEPENHLDYQTIQWLIDALLKFRGGVIFVSHNQYFIDCLANSILELENSTVTVYSMKYDNYLAEKERQITGKSRQWIMEEKTIKRLHRTVEMMKHLAMRNSDTAATYQQTKKRLQKLEEQHGFRPTSEPKKPKIKLVEVEQKRGKSIVSIKDLSFSYGDNQVFKDVNVELRFGEKAVLFGRNGSGKSTLIRLLTGELKPQKGSAMIGVNIRRQLMTQDHLEGINPTQSALEIFHSVVPWPEHRCRAHLAKYHIRADLTTKPLRIISGGQQARFKLALIFAQDPEFCILDEPTNHVDSPTWEAIIEAIQGYSGTVLAVTHDRLFIDAIAEKLWVIQNSQIHVELGTFSDYLARNNEL